MSKPKKIIDENLISVTEESLSEIRLKYNRDQKVSCICSKCNSSFTRSLRFISFPLYCRTCQIEQTAIDRYGSLENMQKINLAHGEETKKLKYGSRHFTNREKCKETKKLRYGDEYFTNRDKCKNTLLSKYGVDNPSQIIGVADKVRKTKLQRYNSETYNNVNKAKQTCLEKYGVENPGCLKATYIYKGERFDSSWELYLWLYCELNNILIERATETFNYDFNGSTHVYHPDFVIDNKLFEVKGDQFFKEDGTMQNPYDHSMDSLYEAKHQCGLKNNVTFLAESDMSEIISYVNNILPTNYIDDFRVS